MTRTGCQGEALRRLAEMPFLDRLELAAVSGWSRGAVYAGVDRLQQRGMVDAIPHASELADYPHRPLPSHRRGPAPVWPPTRASPSIIYSTARPVSARWRRVLLERLDALAVIYRIAAALSNISPPHPVPVVPGRAGGRGNPPARRTLPGRGTPGQHRRPGHLRQAAVAAVRGGAARRRAAAGSRRGPAAPGEPGPGLPAPAGLPGAGRAMPLAAGPIPTPGAPPPVPSR